MSSLSLLSGLSANAFTTDSLTQMKGFPTTETGIEQGVSACFAGHIGAYIVMAGGCNFPVNTLAPDSKKKFYKGIYSARSTTGDQLTWTQIGSLPEPIAYGVAVSCADGMIIAGGQNESGSKHGVYRITLAKDGQARVTALPSMPCKVDNMAGALVGRHLYIVGGMVDGKASNRVLCLDLDHLNRGWKDIQPFPGLPRVQPVAGSLGKRKLCLFGGFAPATSEKEAQLAMDGYLFDEETATWKNLDCPKDEAGEALFVGGGAAINIATDQLLVTGGVNKDIFLAAVNHPQPDYLSHPIAWYQFNPYTLLYNEGGWQVLSKHTETARAGAAMVKTDDGVFVIGGELKPRVRSNQIVKYPEQAPHEREIK